jgi:hypothetical protein
LFFRLREALKSSKSTRYPWIEKLVNSLPLDSTERNIDPEKKCPKQLFPMSLLKRLDFEYNNKAVHDLRFVTGKDSYHIA